MDKGDVDVFMFASWCRFRFYQVDFGWRKPVWMSRIHWAYDATFLLEDGDGIEAWACLEQTGHASVRAR